MLENFNVTREISDVGTYWFVVEKNGSKVRLKPKEYRDTMEALSRAYSDYVKWVYRNEGMYKAFLACLHLY